MELYHTTSQATDVIHKSGAFRSGLFFSSEAVHGDDIIYTIKLSETQIIDARSLFYQDNSDILCADIIRQVQNLCGCDEETAQNYLDESESYQVVDIDSSEISWEIQQLTLECAKELGFSGVKVRDEHGCSYIVDIDSGEISWGFRINFRMNK